jgi:hypothetical protein
MATQSQSQAPAQRRSAAPVAAETGRGWLTYAGVLLLIGAALNIVWGIAAIGNAHFFVNDAQYVFSNLNTWGWITLVIGVALAVAGIGVFNGARWAVWAGVVFLSFNAVDQLLSIPAYPFWSLAMFGLALLAIYGLIAHGGERA